MFIDIRALADPFLCALTNINRTQQGEGARSKKITNQEFKIDSQVVAGQVEKEYRHENKS
jgi:hypothetical protein